jgi:inorganic pyrophosphatase
VIWFDRRVGGPRLPGEYGYVGSYPGVHVVARMLGALVIRTGEAIETKLLCVSERDHQNHLRELDDLPTKAVDELDACFAAYRMLEPGTCEVVDHLGRDEVVRERLH